MHRHTIAQRCIWRGIASFTISHRLRCQTIHQMAKSMWTPERNIPIGKYFLSFFMVWPRPLNSTEGKSSCHSIQWHSRESCASNFVATVCGGPFSVMLKARFIEEPGVEVVDWPAESPDLTPANTFGMNWNADYKSGPIAQHQRLTSVMRLFQNGSKSQQPCSKIEWKALPEGWKTNSILMPMVLKLNVQPGHMGMVFKVATHLCSAYLLQSCGRHWLLNSKLSFFSPFPCEQL